MPGGPPWWQDRFRGYGYRLTIPRQAILGVLERTNKHLSAEDIYLAVYRRYPGIGLTTVYRTLDILNQTGLVFKFDFGDRKARYELVKSPEAVQHHHLICTNCGRVIDYREFSEELDKVKHALAKRYNFRIDRERIDFLGLCEKCKEVV